ncbi:hypothetical protein C2S53_006694 [Perilla frutescens var. hirtella]|uniref:Aminotransferase-like plant mobile domain-containing protein n=1 Tax=Perilla frutescens var. hirtella TaxID=608512 RepID=A0AAD4IPU0_PERFH|nr:hypothetical protein C2S53_006694 [Perilla frutescens var. hirtella]
MASARRQSALERWQAEHDAEEQRKNQMNLNYEKTRGNEGDDNAHEEGDKNANNEDDAEEILRGPFPGGPTDTSVLRSFKTHVAAAIWRGKERDVLKCHSQTTKLLRWSAACNSETWKLLVKSSGLLRLRKVAYRAPNRNLTSAFVEQWHPETNSFHLPFGEMTITLEDVKCLTGLSIEDRPVEFVGEDVAGGRHMVRRLLGVSAEKAVQEVSDRGQYVKLRWLQSRFSELASKDNDRDAVYAARAFLVYILGCTLFTDKTGDRISCNYLRLFEDIEEFGSYAWGAAGLAFLYRQLGVASHVGCRQIASFLTLLEAWIYEHFPTLGRPQQNVDYRAGQPYAMKWAQQAHGAVSEELVKAYRAQLDTLRAEDVVWDPYVRLRDGGERPEVTFYEGCITAPDIIETYLPDWVLRQYRRVQTIPHPHYTPLWLEGARSPDSTALFEACLLHSSSSGRVIDCLQIALEESLTQLRPALMITFSGIMPSLIRKCRVISQLLVEEAFEALHFRTGHEQGEASSRHEQGESSSRRRRRE